MMSDTQYVQAFADYLNKRWLKGQKAAAVMHLFLTRRTPATVADMRHICKQVGLYTDKKKAKGRFLPSQWYILGTPRPKGTKVYRHPQQHTHFFVNLLKDHTVFHKVGDHIRLHPRLHGLTVYNGKFCVQVRGSVTPAPRLQSPARAAPMAPRKLPRAAPAFRRPPRLARHLFLELPPAPPRLEAVLHPDLPPIPDLPRADSMDEAIDYAVRKRSLEYDQSNDQSNDQSYNQSKRRRVSEVVTVQDVHANADGSFDTDSQAEEETYTFGDQTA